MKQITDTFEDIEFLQYYKQELDIKKFNKCNEINIKVFYFSFNRKYEHIKYFDKVYFYIEELIKAINKQMNLCLSEQQKYI